MLRPLVLGLALASALVSAQQQSACVWREDTASCAWSPLYPLGILANATTQLSTAAASWNVMTRGLVKAAYVTELCTQLSTQAACTAALLSDGTQACAWGPFSSASPSCAPAAPLTDYLNITAPSACPEEAPAGQCARDFKCRFEDHFDHAHCLVDMMYVQRALGGAGNPLAVAANTAQHLCSPETVWPVYESPRPPALSRAECESRGAFTLQQGWVARVAAAAGVIAASEQTQQLPATNQSTGAVAQPAATPEADGAIRVPQCQLLGPLSCTPTLAALASGGALPPGPLSSTGRSLLTASLSSLDCLTATASTTTPTTPITPQQQHQCTLTALLPTPALYQDVFSPPCRFLSESQCLTRPGCALKPHGDHSDCVASATSVSDAVGGGALGTRVQQLAGVCQAALVTCGQELVAVSAQDVQQLRQVVASSQGAVEVDDHDHGKFGEETLGLRVASIFVILVAGGLGCAIPFGFQRQLARSPLITQVLQSLSAGVIVCLALVHIAYHASVELDGITDASSSHDHDHAGHNHRRALLGAASLGRMLLGADDSHGAEEHSEEEWVYESHSHPYPIGMAITTAGFILMVLFEHVAQIVHQRQHKRRMQSGGATPAGPCPGAAHCTVLTADATPDSEKGLSKGDTTVGTTGVDDHTTKGGDAYDGRLTVCVAQPCSLTTLPSDEDAFRSQLIAYLFELGCVFHSVIIGVSLGIALTYEDIIPLLVALCFHQFLEGLILGLALVRSSLGRIKQICMAVAYALTCPAGVAIGIGVAYGYDSHSVTARAVQGTLNGIAAGMLLYLGSMWVLTGLWSPQLVKPWHRVASFSALVVGAACMAVLAIWA